MRHRHYRRLCLLIPAAMVTVAGASFATLAGATAASTTGWRNYQCEYSEPGVGTGAFAVDGATVLWQDAPSAAPSAFRLDGVNRNANGRLATQIIDGPKTLKAFVISTETRTDPALNREYESVLEILTPKAILGGCSPLPFGYSARYVSGVLPGDSLNVRIAPSAQSKILTAVEPNGFLWTTGKSNKSWVSVVAVVFSNTDKRNAELVEGWANSRYLSAR